MSTQAETPTTVQGTASCPENAVGVPWSAEEFDAWAGMHAAYRRVTKELEQELSTRHGIGLSGYKLLSRVALSEDGHVRMSELADYAMLSPSRVSRLVDQLERDGYTTRRPCPGDSRVVHCEITPEGLSYLEKIHETYVATVERTFFGRLPEREVKALARAWARLTDD